MRILGPLLVACSIIFGAGGTAYRPLAGPDDRPSSSIEAAEVSRSAQSAGKPVAQSTLPVPPPAPRSSAPACSDARPAQQITVDLSKLKPVPGFVSLNRHGYNYRSEQVAPREAPRDRRPSESDPAESPEAR